MQEPIGVPDVLSVAVRDTKSPAPVSLNAKVSVLAKLTTVSIVKLIKAAAFLLYPIVPAGAVTR
jgi:hypothetical protein